MRCVHNPPGYGCSILAIYKVKGTPNASFSTLITLAISITKWAASRQLQHGSSSLWQKSRAFFLRHTGHPSPSAGGGATE